MIKKLMNYILDMRDRQRIDIALNKGLAMMLSRNIDLTKPKTWEFSGFSQNGEDGILDVLRKQLLSSNRYFIEIGTSDGIENNTTWLVVAQNYSGMMIEGDPKLVARARRLVVRFSIGVECYNLFVTKENIRDLNALAFFHDPDVFSLDIDGNDYYIARSILDGGFEPKIFVVEYNSVYGPEKIMSIEYQENFDFTKAHPTQLYFGVSISGWRKFFERYGYRFVTVDQNGVNAFFVNPAYFDADFLNRIKGLKFADNRYNFSKFGMSHEDQFALIKDQNFVAI